MSLNWHSQWTQLWKLVGQYQLKSKLYCVTVTEALVLHPLLEDQRHITESIRILAPVDRMKQKCFQTTMKRVRRSQKFQLRRQPVPCSRCNNRKGSVANSSTCPQHDEVATWWTSHQNCAWNICINPVSYPAAKSGRRRIWQDIKKRLDFGWGQMQYLVQP